MQPSAGSLYYIRSKRWWKLYWEDVFKEVPDAPTVSGVECNIVMERSCYARANSFVSQRRWWWRTTSLSRGLKRSLFLPAGCAETCVMELEDEWYRELQRVWVHRVTLAGPVPLYFTVNKLDLSNMQMPQQFILEEGEEECVLRLSPCALCWKDDSFYSFIERNIFILQFRTSKKHHSDTGRNAYLTGKLKQHTLIHFKILNVFNEQTPTSQLYICPEIIGEQCFWYFRVQRSL